MRIAPFVRVSTCGALTLIAATHASAQTRHALDPLSATEITRTVNVLRDAGRLTSGSRFGTISVQPQAKSASARRAARVLGFDWSRNQGFLAVVDLDASRVESWAVVDSEPPMRLLTIRRAEEAAHADPRWVAAMQRRKIDTSRVNVLVGLPERAKLPRKGSDRVVAAFVWLRDGVPQDYTVPGVNLGVNLTRGVLETFSDDGRAAPMDSTALMKEIARTRAPLAPLRASQPNGSAARIADNVITWDKWRFRVGVDPRRGLEVHDVSFNDGRTRSVLYSGSISEIFAPYGDSSFGAWYPRDEGDYGMGIYSQSSVVELNDVPANAAFLPSTMHDHLGRPVVIPRAIAVYERDGGLLWRHSNMSRRARQLVVTGVATIDNYDYQFNWIFSQDGAIEGEVVLSGIMNVNGANRRRDTVHVDGHVVTGHLVAPGVNAPNHQHFFSYRLDLDVDGSGNTVYEVDTRTVPSPATRPGELFAMAERPLTSERQAMRDASFAAQRNWRVVNTREKNSLGQFTGYSLVPGAVAPAFASVESAPIRMNGFPTHQLWVTPYAPDELYAAGEFQNLGRDNEGLPTWTKADRPLRDSDVVLWYTLGITHVPRPEDWPYMPAHRGSFRLVPTSFFARNPTLDVPAVRP